MNQYKNLAILQPITGSSVPTDFYASSMGCLSGNIQIIMATDYKVNMHLHIERSFPIDSNRNRAVRKALDGTFDARPDKSKVYPADYIFMMDTDMLFPFHTLPTLFKTMLDTGADLVSGMYYMKGKRFEPVLGRFIDNDHMYYKSIHYWDDEKPFLADVIGPGCCLAKREVFEKIPFPWFAYMDNPEEFGGFKFRDVSEDMHFCREIKRLGLKLVIEPKVQCGHIMTTPVGRPEFESFRDQFVSDLNEQQLKDWTENKIDVRNEEPLNGKA